VGLAYSSQVLAVRSALVGPSGRSADQSGSTWNASEWHWA